MTVLSLRGLTWDHPRGRNALEWSADRHPRADRLVVQWDTQPLAGFESTPIDKIADDYDLIVLDHPHLGEAVAKGALHPIEEWVSAAQTARWRQDTVGPALDSYRYAGHLWAVPLDVACQVAVLRPELINDEPSSWLDVAELAWGGTVALSMTGPHALLTFSSMCVALGEEPGSGERYVSLETGGAALSLLDRLVRTAHPVTWSADPIGLLTAMAEPAPGIRTPPAYCPLVFGYANYAKQGVTHPLRFTEAPVFPGVGRHGSTLGGTGLALTRRCPVNEDVIGYLAWLLDERTQCDVIAAHEGQPSNRAVWQASAVNANAGGFYLGTITTAEQSWVRPRGPGWIAFQNAASELLRRWLLATRRSEPAELLTLINNDFTAVVRSEEGSHG